VPLTLDDASDPVIVVEIRGRLTPSDVETFMATGAHYVGRATHYGMVFVPHTLTAPSFQDLKALLAWMKEHRAELDRWFVAMVLVSDSAVLRGTLRALLGLAPLRAAHFVTANLEEAKAWAAQTIERASAGRNDVR
jgi:hypothetical protein